MRHALRVCGVGQSRRMPSGSFVCQLLCVDRRASFTHAYAVVPEGNVILLPLKSNMNFLGRGDQLVQIVDDCIGFCFGNANYIRDEPYIFGVSISGSRQRTRAMRRLDRSLRMLLSQSEHVSRREHESRIGKTSSKNAHTRVEENRLPPSDGVGTN